MSRPEHGAGPSGAWRDALATLALVAAWLAATAWLRPLMVPDEGRYAGVAWEMVRSGDWLTPTLNGLPFFHKPPLFYWLSGAALWLFGLVEIAGRMGALVGATLGAMALYLFAQRWSGPASARRALVVLLAQPLWLVGGQFANLDMLVAGCITATVLTLAHAALSLEAGLPYRRSLWLAYALAGLGVAAVGLSNLAVSFSLALYVALKARQVSFAQGRRLIASLFARFRQAPREFLMPPRPQDTEESRDQPAG